MGLPCYCCQENENLIVLYNESLCKDFVPLLEGIPGRQGEEYHIGVSLPVRDLKNLYQYRVQAEDALDASMNEGLPVKHAFSAAERVFRMILAEESNIETWIPPDIRNLCMYDREHKTRLMETLLAFLQNGCRYDLTAGQIKTHENTVRYRIKKATEMMEQDPFDPETRENLLLAGLLLKGEN